MHIGHNCSGDCIHLFLCQVIEEKGKNLGKLAYGVFRLHELIVPARFGTVQYGFIL